MKSRFPCRPSLIPDPAALATSAKQEMEATKKDLQEILTELGGDAEQGSTE